MNKSRSEVGALVVSLICAWCFLGGGIKAEEPQQQTIVHGELPSGATLTLYSLQLERPSAASELRYKLYTKPSAGADTDTAFYLAYLPPGSADPSVVWIAYRAVSLWADKPRFTGALISDLEGHLFLVFLESDTTKDSFSISKIDVTMRVAAVPPRLDVERREEWPRPSSLLSSISYEPPKSETLRSCTVSALHAEWKDGAVKVRAVREPEGCGSLVTAFDPASTKWAEVQKNVADE